MIYTISYDLKKPGQNYNDLINAIKSLGAWARPCESYWLVETELNSAAIYEFLKQYLDSNDVMLVSRFSNDDFSGRVNDSEIIQWVKDKVSKYNSYHKL